MRKHTRLCALAVGAVAALGAAFAAGACSSSSAPPTVQSGYTGASSMGMSQGSGSGSGTGSDAGSAFGDAGVTVYCNAPTLFQCTTYTGVPASLAPGVQTQCGGNTGAPCTATNVIGCCTTLNGTYTVEACYYGGSTATEATQSGCPGTFTLQP